MRISSSIPAFYNAGRINHDNTRVERIERVNPVEELKGINSLTELKNDSLFQGNRGVKETKVSPDNSFQKAMATDASFAYERMAGKLVDKLPRILKDMENLPALEKRSGEISSANTGGKVIISEDGRMKGQKAPVPEMEDISL